MHIANLQCEDNESFKYSRLLYLYYYNIKSNYGRISQLNNNIKPYIPIEFNNNNDIYIYIYINLKRIINTLTYVLLILMVNLCFYQEIMHLLK